jgi:hypothetical protein
VHLVGFRYKKENTVAHSKWTRRRGYDNSCISPGEGSSETSYIVKYCVFVYFSNTPLVTNFHICLRFVEFITFNLYVAGENWGEVWLVVWLFGCLRWGN